MVELQGVSREKRLLLADAIRLIDKLSQRELFTLAAAAAAKALQPATIASDRRDSSRPLLISPRWPADTAPCCACDITSGWPASVASPSPRAPRCHASPNAGPHGLNRTQPCAADSGLRCGERPELRHLSRGTGACPRGPGCRGSVPAFYAPGLPDLSQQASGVVRRLVMSSFGIERPALTAAASQQLRDPGALGPVCLEVLRRLLGPQPPDAFTAATDLVMRCGKRNRRFLSNWRLICRCKIFLLALTLSRKSAPCSDSCGKGPCGYSTRQPGSAHPQQPARRGAS